MVTTTALRRCMSTFAKRVYTLLSAVLQCTPPGAVAPELPLPWFPCCCWLVWYSTRCTASVDIECGLLCPENRSSAVCVGSATCSVVRYVFRSVTATNRALLFPALEMRWGLCVFHFHFCLRHCLASRILFFCIFCNGEAVQFGRDPCEEVNSL